MPLPLFPPQLDQPPSVLADRAQAGPRYTSYPPATRFRDDFRRAEALTELAAIPEADPISLYVHVPFCSQLCWYCGCNVIVTRDRSRGARYVDHLARELDLLADAVGPHPLAELALGGGSPNFLGIEDLRRLLGEVLRRFVLTDDAELGIELDPRDTTEAQVEALALLGFARMSVGVQDFDPAVQQTIHRAQSVAQTRAVIEHGRAHGFRSVNVDLVYGLPGQTTATLRATLDAVVSFRPERIAVFGYAHVPHLKPHQRLLEQTAPVPGLPVRATLLATVMSRLADAGYVRVGLDHFARPDDPLVAAARDGRLHRNFQGYVVKHAERLLGVGPSAISDAGHAYWQNEVRYDAWAAALERGELPIARGVRLDADDELRRYVIMRLMCEGRIAFDDVERRFGIRFASRFAPELARLDRDLAVVEARALVATPLGAHLIRNVARVFDRHTADGAGGSPTI